jgi:hypothetical protein
MNKTVRYTYARKMSIFIRCPGTRKCRIEFLRIKLLDRNEDVVYRNLLNCKK